MSVFGRRAVIVLVLASVALSAQWGCGSAALQEVEELTIKVDSRLKPKIPRIKVKKVPDPHNSAGTIRRVTFKTDKGTAWVFIPVAGKVISQGSEQVSLSSRVTALKADTNGATLVITEKNEQEIEVEYQVLCDDGKDRYWAEGQSPPRIIIPKW
ncbi:MAG: hypothetical protein KAJ97_04530 [Acidobacteria bacterium]|nr:hypothetical protein [Acidobacteriota bacterium]